MAINTYFKFLIISLFTLFIIECKGSQKNDNTTSDKNSVLKKEVKEQFSEINEIDFIKSFYTKKQ